MHNNSVGVVSKVFPNKIALEIIDISNLNYNFLGDLYTCDGINTFITINKSRYQKFIYQIIGLYEQEKPYDKEEEESKFQKNAFFEAIPIGEVNGSQFEYGLSRFPMIGDDVYLTVNQDIANILQLSGDNLSISLGKMVTHNDFVPKFSIDDLFTSHMSVLGNTGSGKSTTVRKLLHEIIGLSNKEKINLNNVNFVIFDVHDEYKTLPDEDVNNVQIKDISIPLKTLTTEDWINLVQPSTAVQLPVLKNGLRMGNLLESGEVENGWIKAFCALELYNNVQTEAVAKRTKIVSILEEVSIDGLDDVLSRYDARFGNFATADETRFKELLEKYIEQETGLEYNVCRNQIEGKLEECDCSVDDINTLKLGIEIILLFEEIKGNAQIRSYNSTLMTRIDNLASTYSNSLFDNSQDKINSFQDAIEFRYGFTIFKCSSLEDTELLFFTSYILRLLYQRQKINRSDNNTSKNMFHFIFDEAHKYITEDDTNATMNSLKMFEQIAKEGRKFGIFMILASQRPGELSKTVLSQCNNFILHRIRNNIDIEQMRRSIPYINDAQLNRLTYLKTGSALLVGDAFPIPMELDIKGEKYGIYSRTLLPSEMWSVNN